MTARFIAILLIMLAAGVAILSHLPASGPRQSPSNRNFSCGGKVCNVIFLVNDTLAAEHLSVYGYNRPTTPFLDRFFGTEGLVFKNMSSNAPWTLASFASFFTSQYPSDIKLETYQDKLDPKIPAFPEELAKNGVDVAGFYLAERNSGVFSRFPEENSGTAGDPLTFDLGIDWIKNHANSGKPFMIMIHNRIVHEPYDPPIAYRQLFGAPETYPGSVLDTDLDAANKNPSVVTPDQHDRYVRQYDQEVRYTDDQTKRFVEDLPKAVLDSSIIIFIADHGEALGEHGVYGHANILYQQVLHVPFMVHGPGIAPAVINSVTSLLNLGPTIMDIFGLTPPNSFKGHSLLPSLTGQPLVDETVRVEQASKIWPGGTRLDRKPFIRTDNFPNRGWLVLRSGNLKVIKNPDASLEVYDLNLDPGERNNLSMHPPEAAVQLEKLLN